jgi:hypothetical protein
MIRLAVGACDVLTSEADEASDDGSWNVVNGRRLKRARRNTSPPTLATSGLSYAGAAACEAQSKPQPVKQIKKPKLKSLIGESETSSLRASKNLQLPKAVYRLGNIDSVYSADNVKDFVTLLGVRILTCFELTHTDRQPKDNKAFRICIVAADRDKLFASAKWSVGITLREWRHKPKKDGLAAEGTGAGRVEPGGAQGEGSDARNDAGLADGSINNDNDDNMVLEANPNSLL